MDFFASQDRALRNTWLLMGWMAVAVAGIVAAVYFTMLFAAYCFDEHFNAEQLWHPELFVVTVGGTLTVVLAGSLYKTFLLSRGGSAVAEMLGGRLVHRATNDLEMRKLLNVVEEMAIAAGMPVPPVYLLESEQGINAFAAGFSPADAVIGVTRGCVHQLTRDELQGVMAHEFSHVFRGDMRLNLRLIGLLHGILLISLIGWILMRTGARRSYFSSKSKKGGNPLPLIGLALYVIGYVGVLVGHLIKAAVSRQREFLADAAAVQFTRNPDGIAGALKKIGGASSGSRIRHSEAEEASHMFFANSLAESFVNLFATHPPLSERIRRIQPNWDGKYVRPAGRPTVELESARYLQSAEPDFVEVSGAPSGGGRWTGAAAAAMAAPMTDLVPVELISHVGNPTQADLVHAREIINSMPPALEQAVGDAFSARAAVLALLWDHEDATVARRQRELLESHGEPALTAEVVRLAPETERLHARLRLPLVELALPALKQLSRRQFEQFCALVEQLSAANELTSLFEYAVARMLLRNLGRHFGRWRMPLVRHLSVEPVRDAIAVLMSCVARAGHAHDEQVAQAFELGIRPAIGRDRQLELQPLERCRLMAVDEALKKLSEASPGIRQRVLTGCAACIGFDGTVTVEEAELIRAIADALDCPLPPIVAQHAQV